jgi:hypothetical protein
MFPIFSPRGSAKTDYSDTLPAISNLTFELARELRFARLKSVQLNHIVTEHGVNRTT